MKKHEHYDVGLYLRLSKDDDVRSGDSSSITSRKAMLEKYVRDNGWAVHDCYIDDGYTGTNFSRPEFQRMIEDIIGGGITEARFRKLTAKYEAEQSAKEKAASEIIAEIERTIANKKDASAWLELIRNYTDIQELDRVVIGELIEKITVSEAQVIDGVKHVDITIYYRFVGAVNTANLTARKGDACGKGLYNHRD